MRPMPKTLLAATTNEGKLREIAEILAPLGLDLRTPLEFPLVVEAPEDTGTFEGNALRKARHWHAATGLAVLADDSGLCVDALDGQPGVHSARYAPSVAERNAKLLAALRDLPPERRGAHFVCVAAFIDESGRAVTAEGRCEGRIHHEPRGSGGFGYDPLFWVDECACTVAELPSDVKHTLSHRGRALQALRPALERWVRGGDRP